MLIHELTIAVQHDRERDMRTALVARRHLADLPRRAGAGIRARLGRAPRPVLPAPTGQTRPADHRSA